MTASRHQPVLMNRRSVILGLSMAGALATVSAPSFANAISIESAEAITKVYGDGLRFVAIAVTYSAPIPASVLSAEQFSVAGKSQRPLSESCRSWQRQGARSAQSYF